MNYDLHEPSMSDATSATILDALAGELEATVGGLRAPTSETPAFPERSTALRRPGSWFGFVHQPGLFLGGRTVVELVVDEAANVRTRDEHGLARVEIESDPDCPIAFRKTYEGKSRPQSYVYRGRTVGRLVVGYWQSEERPDFVGTFAFVAETELTTAQREDLRARIPGWSWRRALFLALVALVVALPVLARAGVRFGPIDGRLFAPLPLVAIAAFAITLRRSARAMGRRVAQLRRELANP